jgi:hypothetical protein
MSKRALKNFSDLEFIQTINKPRYMAGLLRPHADYFSARGLEVGHLGNDNGCDRKLLEAFTTADGDFPPKLLNDLYVLDDLAGEDGRNCLLDEAENQGVALEGIVGGELSDGDFAIAVHLAYPCVTTVCHDKLQSRKTKNFEEYQGRVLCELTLSLAKEKVSALQAAMSSWFAAKDRTCACEIYVYEEPPTIKFQITHGNLFRVQPVLDGELTRSRTGLRPQKHDVVFYNANTGVLKVHAQTLGERNLYRRAFGEVLFGDTEHFPEGDLYTLEPLRKGKPALAPVPGIEWARLTEVSITVEDESGFAQHSRAYDLLDAAARHGQPNLQQGRLVRAAMMVKYKSGGRPRKLELRPPRVAVFDRDRDGDFTEHFLRANGFFSVGE